MMNDTFFKLERLITIIWNFGNGKYSIGKTQSLIVYFCHFYKENQGKKSALHPITFTNCYNSPLTLM